MKRLQIITIVLAVLLIFNIYNVNNRVEELRRTISNQNNYIRSLEESIYGISRSVNATLTSFEEENKWVSSKSIGLVSIPNDGENIEIAVEWSFNNLQDNEEIYLMVGVKNPANGMEWDKIKADKVADLHYRLNLTLPLKVDYILQTMAEGEASKRLVELSQIPLYSSMRERIRVHGDVRAHNNNQGFLYLDISISPLRWIAGFELSDDVLEMLSIETAMAEVFLDGKLIESFNIMDELIEHKAISQYGEAYLGTSKPLNFEGINEGKLYVIVTITDALGETYEYRIEQ